MTHIVISIVLLRVVSGMAPYALDIPLPPYYGVSADIHLAVGRV